MKINKQHIAGYLQLINKLKLSAQASLVRVKFMIQLQEELIEVQNSLGELAKVYSKKDSNGEVVVDESGGVSFENTEDMINFQKGQQQLLQSETELFIPKEEANLLLKALLDDNLIVEGEEATYHYLLVQELIKEVEGTNE